MCNFRYPQTGDGGVPKHVVYASEGKAAHRQGSDDS